MVAKVSVCPATLSDLRERARSFRREPGGAQAREGSQPGGKRTAARGGASAMSNLVSRLLLSPL